MRSLFSRRSPGVEVAVRIHAQPFHPWQDLEDYQRDQLPPGSYGATAVFVGTMRNMNEGRAVETMTLEHYPGMTEGFLQGLSDRAKQRWALQDVLIVHRVGELNPDDPIVLVAVWSAHRKAAFEASRFLMEALKSGAPLWKKEWLENGARWVEQNTPG